MPLTAPCTNLLQFTCYTVCIVPSLSFLLFTGRVGRAVPRGTRPHPTRARAILVLRGGRAEAGGGGGASQVQKLASCRGPLFEHRGLYSDWTADNLPHR